MVEPIQIFLSTHAIQHQERMCDQCDTSQLPLSLRLSHWWRKYLGEGQTICHPDVTHGAPKPPTGTAPLCQVKKISTMITWASIAQNWTQNKVICTMPRIKRQVNESDKPRYQCQYCSKPILSQGGLKIHLSHCPVKRYRDEVAARREQQLSHSSAEEKKNQKKDSS